MKLDIEYIKLCKQEHLLPTFATVQLSIQTKNNKLKNRIGRIEHELESKTKLLRKKIKSLSIQLKKCHYQWFRAKVIKLRHNTKICNLRKRHGTDKLSKTKPPKNVIHYLLSYDLTGEEIQALWHGLDQHNSSNPYRYKINTNFEYFYLIILNEISNLLQHHLDNIKTKLRSICMKYHNSKAANKYKKFIDRLSKNNIIIIKQDKVCVVIILDRTKYIDKCLSM